MGGKVKVVDTCHLISHLRYEMKEINVLFIGAVENK